MKVDCVQLNILFKVADRANNNNNNNKYDRKWNNFSLVYA